MSSSNIQIIRLLIFVSLGWSNFAKFVTVEQGTLRGTTKVSQNGTVFNAYFGIPYARPPIGKLRFQPPLKAQPWNGTFNATSAGAKCIQIGTGSEPIVGVEDCLNINVFTPRDAEPGDNIPVIVLIFGGTFKQRSNLEDGPLFFMDRRVIIVIPNYRLGVLGFMSTGDAVISGNMGLKDQVMALRWVRDNIRAFGGDPNRVTLQGHSSGSMCVHLHTFSPLSVGLFRRIIIQSGTGNSPSGFFDRDVATSVGLELAQHLGCDRNTSKEILDCFLTLSAEQFSQAQEKLYLWQNEPNAAFRPTVEVVDAKSPFLTVAPPNARHPTTDYEWLIGTSSGECAYKAAGYLSGKGEAAKELDKDYKELFPISMQYLWTVNLQYVNQISSTIRHHFFGEDRINDTTAIPLMNMYTEELFTQPTYEAIKKFTGTKYVYLFDYYSNVSLQNTNGVYQRRLGVSHGEELHLLYWHSTSVNRLTNRDLAVGSELVTRWLNFAYSGNPNIPFSINERMFSAWKPADPTSSRIRYLRIAINGTMEKDYGEKSNRFWKNIPIMGKFF